jgi:NDP-sugar pyrophosphorylase family protein
MHRVEDLLDLAHCPCPELFAGIDYPWQALPRIERYLAALPPGRMRGTLLGSAAIDPNVIVGEGTTIEHGAVLRGPAVIGKNCEIRANCYVRGNVIAGDGCVLGNASEFKNCILFDQASAPHFAYVGDSVLGYAAHLGAGVICSNYKSLEPREVTVKYQDPGRASGPPATQSIPTGLRKFGAIVGDRADVGCHTVLHPGSVIGRASILYPNLAWRGVLEGGMIVKLRQEQAVVARMA